MKLFIMPLESEKVEEIKKIFYKYQAKGDMLQKVIEHQEDGTNNEMFERYAESYEEAAAIYKDKFMEFVSMIPYYIEVEHQMEVSVSFTRNRLEVKQLCECNIDDIMISAGFERIK